MNKCKFCNDDFAPKGLAQANGFHCTKCTLNFGAMYCFECLSYYYDMKRQLCLNCELGVQG